MRNAERERMRLAVEKRKWYSAFDFRRTAFGIIALMQTTGQLIGSRAYELKNSPANQLINSASRHIPSSIVAGFLRAPAVAGGLADWWNFS